MMQNLIKLLFIFLVCISLSCSSDDEVGQISINFNNVVGNENLVLNEANYQKSAGETIEVSELKYIISNIVLIDINGNEFVYPQADSYFLINHEIPDSHRIILQNVNANNYKSIRFGIGIDQSNYPLNGVDNFVPTAEENFMLWSWSAGYIFMKIEGLYTSGQTTDMPFRYHIGSHGQNLDNYTEVSLDFLQPIAISQAQDPEVNVDFDVLKIFSGQYEMRLDDKDDIQIDPDNAPKIRENYAQAFTIGLN